MHNTLKISLIAMLVTGAIIGGISIKNLSMLYTTNKELYDSNIKENHINDVTVDFQNIHKSDADKDLNSSFNKNNLNDSSQYNSEKKKETINSNIKEPSHNIPQEQIIINSKLEDENSNTINNQVSVDEQTTINSELKNENNNVNIEDQTNTNTTLEEKIPVIQYDRTTSIYTDDYNTLLRIEYYMNNKLTYYSVIEEYDVTTKSYIEKIYQCNRETNIDPLIRTDIYVNGNLTKSY